MSEKTTPNKNVYAKLFAFRESIISEKKKPSEACKEQSVCIVYEDDVKEVGGVIYFVSKIHFIDTASGNEVVAQALAEKMPCESGDRKAADQTPVARQWAFVALMGGIKNMHSQEVPDVINQLNPDAGKADTKPAAPTQNIQKPAEAQTEKPAPAQTVQKPAPAPASNPAPKAEKPAEKPAPAPAQNNVPSVTNAEPVQSGKPEAEPDGGGLPTNFSGWGNWKKK